MNELTTKDSIQNHKHNWNVYLDNFLRTKNGKSYKTIIAYRQGVRAFLNYMNGEDPLPDDIHDFVGHLNEKGYSRFTIGLYMISLKLFFAYLQKPYGTVGAKSISIYPDIYKIAKPEIQRPIRGKHYKEIPTEEAIKRLRKQLLNKRSRKAKRDLLMIDLALYCGLRVNEIANVRDTDLVKDGDNYRLSVLRKGYDAKINSVFVAEDLVKRMKGYISKYKIEGYVFTDISHLRSSGHLCSSTVSTIITSYMKKAEIKKDTISAHSLRHHALTTYYQVTHDLYATQVFAGHRDSKTTKVYMHCDQNYERNAVALQPA